MRTTVSSSLSICVGISGRGWRKSSKSAAENQHLAGAVVAKVVVALFVLRGSRPVREVLLLALRLLREEVVGKSDRELAVVVELLDDSVVLGIVLEAAARVDGSGDAEPIQLAHEVPGGIELIVERQLRPLG